jgi:hypothetical protein
MADLAGANGQQTEFKVVGKRNIPCKLAYNLATGKAKFEIDATAPNMLHAKFLRICPAGLRFSHSNPSGRMSYWYGDQMAAEGKDLWIEGAYAGLRREIQSRRIKVGQIEIRPPAANDQGQASLLRCRIIAAFQGGAYYRIGFE